MKVSVAQLCPTLRDSEDYSPPGSSFYRILQTRILEWVAMPFSRGSARCKDKPGSPVLQADSLLSEPRGKPQEVEEASPVTGLGGFLGGPVAKTLHSHCRGPGPIPGGTGSHAPQPRT